MIYKDIWQAWHDTRPSTTECLRYAMHQQRGAGLEVPTTCRVLPRWLAILYIGANTALTVLNFYWYSKMIAAVRKRFVPKEEKAQARAKKDL
jgi:hypothetical protein